MENPAESHVRAAHSGRTLAIMCHLTALIGMLLLAVPVGSILGPLILWLAKRADDPDVELHGKESLNFQLSVGIYLLSLGCLAFLTAGLMIIPVICLIAIPLLFLLGIIGAAIGVADLVLIIIASIQTGEGRVYRYPFNLRLIR